jgi:osmotically-inducible protein OsmY
MKFDYIMRYELKKPTFLIEPLPDKAGSYQKGVNAMKKWNRFVSYVVLVMFIAAFVACASTSKQESTGEYVDDSVITTKVKSLLAADDFLKSFQIGVETYKGVVQLSGFVNSQQAVDKAIQISRSVKGVTSVRNDLIVK